MAKPLVIGKGYSLLTHRLMGFDADDGVILHEQVMLVEVSAVAKVDGSIPYQAMFEALAERLWPVLRDAYHDRLLVSASDTQARKVAARLSFPKELRIFGHRDEPEEFARSVYLDMALGALAPAGMFPTAVTVRYGHVGTGRVGVSPGEVATARTLGAAAVEQLLTVEVLESLGMQGAGQRFVAQVKDKGPWRPS